MVNNLYNILKSKFLLILLFIILFFGGFFVRLYKFSNPIADWHSWLQLYTSYVSRFFVNERFDYLHPKYYDISNIQTGHQNPKGYRFVEFPLYNFFQASLYKALPVLTLEEWGRVVSIIASLSTALFLFLLLRKYSGLVAAFAASFFYLFLPFSIYYGRTILPDTTMVAASFAGIYFFDRYLSSTKTKWKIMFFILAAIFSLASLLLKPFAAFYLLVQLYIVIQKHKFALLRKWELYIYPIIVVLPLVLWRMWLSHFPEGVPASMWLLNGDNIRFKGAFFFWIFGERISKLIFGYFGAFFVLLGILKQEREKNYFLSFSFLIAIVLYITIVAKGNVQHDYYQIVILPVLCLFAGRGISFLLSLRGINKAVGIVICSVVIFLTFSLSWFYVRDFFNINNEAVVIAGVKADEVLPKNARVIAPYGGDTTFLYYINRQGWPALVDTPENLKRLGATHMVLVNPTTQDFEGFGKMYTIVSSSDTYLILQL